MPVVICLIISGVYMGTLFTTKVKKKNVLIPPKKKLKIKNYVDG
jgi:hypothetical protein